MIHTDRMAAQLDGEFVVFLIGMRINRPWKVHAWWPVATAMPKMIRELYAQPHLGLLGHEMWFGRTTLMLQYWRSFEQLEYYARSRDAAHLPVWADFNRRIRSGADVGIWHETYLVDAGRYENIYVNMPSFGLGKVGELAPASGRREAAAGRLGRPEAG